MMKFSTNTKPCFKCRKIIDIDTQIFYLFLGKTSTENAIYCVDCYLQDIKKMTQLDPFVTKLYSKNFIRMVIYKIL